MQIEVRSTEYDPLSSEVKSRLAKNLEFIFNVTPQVQTEYLKINITDDFSNDVIRFQNTHGTAEKGHSKGAVGKVCEYKDLDGNLQITIFLDIDKFKNVLDLPYTECGREIHYVQHELGHVYDDSNTASIFPETFLAYDFLTEKKRVLYEIAKIGWSEFQANVIACYSIDKLMRISNSSTLLEELYLKYGNDLASNLLQLEKNVALAKDEIRATNGFCTTIQFYTRDILYYSGIFIGIILAFELYKDEETYKYIQEKFQEINFADNLTKLVEIFQQLNSIYPYWATFEVLNPLCEWIENYWETIGFKVTESMIFSLKN